MEKHGFIIGVFVGIGSVIGAIIGWAFRYDSAQRRQRGW